MSTKKIQPITQENLKHALVAYLNYEQETQQASKRVRQAEEEKSTKYAAQCACRDAIIESWKSFPGNENKQPHGLYQLPDGRMVRIDGNLIWLEEVQKL